MMSPGLSSRPAKHRTEHDHIGTSSQGFDDVTAVFEATIGDTRECCVYVLSLAHSRTAVNCGITSPSHNAGSTNRASANTDFYSVGTSIRLKSRVTPCSSSGIATNNRNVWVACSSLHAMVPRTSFGVTMSGINDHNIYLCRPPTCSSRWIPFVSHANSSSGRVSLPPCIFRLTWG